MIRAEDEVTVRGTEGTEGDGVC